MPMNVGKPWRSSVTCSIHTDSVRTRRAERLTLFFLLLLSMLLILRPASALAGASCVVAKELGNSLAIEWVASYSESAQSALAKAMERLRQQGFKRQKLLDLHAQASTELPHAYVIIVRTQYANWRGKQRTSYGCGFSPNSYEEAGLAALNDLRNFSWEWKLEYGYEVIEKSQY